MPIVVNDLSYQYGTPGNTQFALEHVSFTVEEGAFLGIAGHTGSGKSTLVQHLNGLIPSAARHVTVDGHDLGDKAERKLARSLVGMVFQYPEYQLFAETVYDDVAFGPKNLKLSEDEIRERVLTALQRVGLDPDTFKDKSPFELSGGEKRRAALAGVLAMRPKYLVLDEPMAGLDPNGRSAILKILDQLRREDGCTILMISHSMEDLARHATRMIVLDRGKIAFDDTPKQVFEHAEELFALGLSVPQMTYLSMLLRQKGFDAPSVYNDETALLEWIEGRIRHA